MTKYKTCKNFIYFLKIGELINKKKHHKMHSPNQPEQARISTYNGKIGKFRYIIQFQLLRFIYHSS